MAIAWRHMLTLLISDSMSHETYMAVRLGLLDNVCVLELVATVAATGILHAQDALRSGFDAVHWMNS